MLSSSIPTFFQKIFGASAGASYITQPIPVPSQIGISDGRASQTDGFPPDTFLPPQAGGIPPDGRDVNGILYMLSAWAQWSSAGGPMLYDATFSGNVNGYPKGALIMASTFANLWQSTVDNNTTNPDSGGANWTAISLIQTPLATPLNLVGSSAGAVKTASWTVNQLVAATALSNGVCYEGTSLTLNFNGAGTGAGGMDTGSTPLSSSLYIYAIYNPTTATWSTLGTTSGAGAEIYGGANMPAGYTASRLLGAFVTNGSGQFTTKFYQQGRTVYTTAVTIANVGLTTTPLLLSAGGVVNVCPASAKWAAGQMTLTCTVSNTVYMAGDSGAVGSALGASAVGTTSAASGVTGDWGPVPFATAQTLWTASASNAGTPSIVAVVTSYGF